MSLNFIFRYMEAASVSQVIILFWLLPVR